MRGSILSRVVARRLEQAEREQMPIEPLSKTYEGLSPEMAYEIQSQWLNEKLSQGRRIVGHKIGLTSKAMQQQMSVDQPDYGFLLDTMIIPSGGTLPTSELIQARIEPEIAFWLAKDLRGPQVTLEEALAATRGVSAALEVVDSRITDWRITLADTIADNASSARVVVSEEMHALDGLDLRAEYAELLCNGNIVGSGTGAAVMGHPAAAVAWLANKLAEFGVTLHAGELVLPGAMCASVRVSRGDHFQALFTNLGIVQIRFGQ